MAGRAVVVGEVRGAALVAGQARVTHYVLSDGRLLEPHRILVQSTINKLTRSIHKSIFLKMLIANDRAIG